MDGKELSHLKSSTTNKTFGQEYSHIKIKKKIYKGKTQKTCPGTMRTQTTKIRKSKVG